MSDGAGQKAYYPDEDLKEWVERTAKKNDRSESKVAVMLLQSIMESVDKEPIDLHDYDIDVTPE